VSKERSSPSAAESISESISGWANLEPRLWQCMHWFGQMEQECIGGSEHGLGKPGGLSGKVKARLKRGVVSVSVWCRKIFSEGRRTWEGSTFCQSMELLEDMGASLHLVTQTCFNASFTHYLSVCHSPHSVMACLFLQHKSLLACHSPLSVGIQGVLSNLINWFWTQLLHFLLSVALCLHIAATK